MVLAELLFSPSEGLLETRLGFIQHALVHQHLSTRGGGGGGVAVTVAVAVAVAVTVAVTVVVAVAVAVAVALLAYMGVRGCLCG